MQNHIHHRGFRRGIAVLLCAALMGGTAACSKAVPDVDLSNTQALGDNYLFAPFIAIMLGQSWDSPEQIDPDYFINYYFCDNDKKGQEWYKEEWSGQYGEDDNGTLVPAEPMEAYVRSHFEVSSEFLRGASNYNAEKKAYAFGGVGSAAYYVVNEAKQDGKTLRIFYHIISANDIPLGSGVLTLEVSSETDYRYRSNTIEELPSSILCYPMSMGETLQDGIFVMQSGGTGSVTPPDGQTVSYDGGDLDNVVKFYLDDALPALGAAGSVQEGKNPGGWAWSGTYKDGKPLTIDIIPSGEEYQITAVFDQ